MLETHAPAKINLYLHVTGKRADGYHLLDSLVTFTNIGDRVSLEKAEEFKFTIDGPMGGALSRHDPKENLIVRAAQLLAQKVEKELDVHINLTKNLPLASGIGGGSTDAAAALRLLAIHWGMAPDARVLHEVAASLGQDIPCCIAAQNCYFRDIGNVTDPGPKLPLTHMVLVNPGHDLPTPSVFKARTGSFSPAHQLEAEPQTPEELSEMLSARGNSLTEAAVSLCPSIQDVLTALEDVQGCLLSRMSGSGATCFGLFADRSAARQAASELMTAHPTWWVVPAHIPSEPFLPTER